MAKFLILTIQVNLVPSPSETWCTCSHNACKNVLTTFTQNTCCCTGSVLTRPWISSLYFLREWAISELLACFCCSFFFPSLCLVDFIWYTMLLFFKGNSSLHAWQKSFPDATVNGSWGYSVTRFWGLMALGLLWELVDFVFLPARGFFAIFLFREKSDSLGGFKTLSKETPLWLCNEDEPDCALALSAELVVELRTSVNLCEELQYSTSLLGLPSISLPASLSSESQLLNYKIIDCGLLPCSSYCPWKAAWEFSEGIL